MNVKSGLKAEVRQNYVSAHVDENVLRLEISMDDPMSMKLVEGNQNLCHKVTNRMEGYITFRKPTQLDSTSDVGDVHIGNDVEGGRVVEGGDERQEPRGAPEPGESVDLAVELAVP